MAGNDSKFARKRLNATYDWIGQVENEASVVWRNPEWTKLRICILGVSICRPFSFGYRKFGEKNGSRLRLHRCAALNTISLKMLSKVFEALKAAANLEELFKTFRKMQQNACEFLVKWKVCVGQKSSICRVHNHEFMRYEYFLQHSTKSQFSSNFSRYNAKKVIKCHHICPCFCSSLRAFLGSDVIFQSGNELSFSSNNMYIGATPSHWNNDDRGM